MKAIPWATGVMFIRPFRGDGLTAAGIAVVHSEKLPPIYGRVLAAHRSCRHVEVGDWIVYRARKPIRIEWRGGVVYALSERNVVAVVRRDGAPWFAEALALA